MRLVLLAVTALALGGSPAYADPPGMTPIAPLTQPAEPAPTPPTDGYRGTMIALDGAAITAVMLSHGNKTVVQLAVATYVVGGPVLHLWHDRPKRALASAALRVGLPLVLGLAGARALSGGSDDDEGPIVGAALGILAGGALAIGIDVAALAGPDDAPQRSWQPAISTTRSGGMTFGIAGSL